jgi:hypothetical protein
MYQTIGKWLEQDNAPTKSEYGGTSSFDVDEVVGQIKARYLKTGGDENG